MINKSLLILLIVCLAGAGCKSRKPSGDGSVPAEKHTMTGPGPFVKLNIAKPSLIADSVMLSFTVYNNSDTVQRFCKWHTPFEPLLAKYLNVTDAAGNEASYLGAMAKRIMPPPASSYINVNPHDSVSTVFNLSKGYAVKPGRYTVSYIGTNMSGLQPANELKILVPGK